MLSMPQVFEQSLFLLLEKLGRLFCGSLVINSFALYLARKDRRDERACMLYYTEEVEMERIKISISPRYTRKSPLFLTVLLLYLLSFKVSFPLQAKVP